MHANTTDTGMIELVVLGLVPVNLFVLCVLKERGAFGRHGLLRLIFIIFEGSLALYLVGGDTSPVPAGVLDPFGPPISSLFGWSPFHQTTTILLIVSFLGCLTMMGLDNTPISEGMTTALLTLVLGSAITTEHAWPIFVMAGALYLGASLIRDSYNMAYRDELTGLPHRRALNEQFLSMSSRYSLAMLDVDHFKKFNDKHGHDVGDQVLQMVAGKIRQVKGGGKAYRYGGEEFSIVFPRMNKDDAYYYLDEVRKAIQNYEMVIRKDPRVDEQENRGAKRNRQKGSFRRAEEKVSVTISIGVADRVSFDQSPDDVLKTADEALYRAKKAGRNQVSI